MMEKKNKIDLVMVGACLLFSFPYCTSSSSSFLYLTSHTPSLLLPLPPLFVSHASSLLLSLPLCQLSLSLSLSSSCVYPLSKDQLLLVTLLLANWLAMLHACLHCSRPTRKAESWNYTFPVHYGLHDVNVLIRGSPHRLSVSIFRPYPLSIWAKCKCQHAKKQKC